MSRARDTAEPADISLRTATEADREFCYHLHRITTGGIVTAIHGWDEDAQREIHNRAYSRGRWRIIMVGDIDVGVLVVEYREMELYLARLELLPDRQGRAIGSALVRVLLAEAHHRGQPLALEVFAANRRARALFARLGLHEVSRAGVEVRMRSASPP